MFQNINIIVAIQIGVGNDIILADSLRLINVNIIPLDNLMESRSDGSDFIIYNTQYPWVINM